MLISEVCARTGLTRKAVRYYVDKGLLSPAARENGYRDFSADDMRRLGRIAVLRRLRLGLSDIRAALADESALGSICARRERELRRGLRGDRVSLLTRAERDEREAC